MQVVHNLWLVLPRSRCGPDKMAIKDTAIDITPTIKGTDNSDSLCITHSGTV
jgi:hypothetical protein